MSETSGYVRPKWAVKLRRTQRRAINIYGSELRLSVFVALHGDTPLYVGMDLDKLQRQVAAFQSMSSQGWPREEGQAVDEQGWHQGPGNPWVRGHWAIYKQTIFSCPWPAVLMLAVAYGFSLGCAIYGLTSM